MSRAKSSAGGEGKLTLAVARDGVLYAIFTNEGHRAAFVVALQRHSVTCELQKGLPSGIRRKTSSLPGESELAAVLGDMVTDIINILAATRKKR